MKILSIDAWAKREEVNRRTAYRWVNSGKVPIMTRTVELIGIPENITKEHLGKKDSKKNV